MSEKKRKVQKMTKNIKKPKNPKILGIAEIKRAAGRIRTADLILTNYPEHRFYVILADYNIS